ncbi:MAG: DEAD/DEAH box helicase [Verrucomicrobia bacterium]|nr:DEAD/DEAH box helicase [Verrucomicrobiota bacterium]
MSAFDRLHPTIQHHVVNTMGWRELRPLQDASIDPVLDGAHTLLIAPTAGGKTEAAFLPLLSRMASEDWKGLSVIYLCPLKALLNNLHIRLHRYCQWVGRSCAVWHGDVLESGRKAILRELPDCLLTTPESLEAILVSTRIDHRKLFRTVRAVVVDEVHAFAGDDRGWHTLSVLERVTKLAGRELQRVGLSATVGNPDELLAWLAGHCEGQRKLIRIVAAASQPEPEIGIDYVGSLENAAVVLAGLYRGEKRLVFCDSRSRVEQLGLLLREAGVETYVSHSSLSADERRSAEQAFSEGGNCVIVATSTLELGIDVGDLDRVIQIDAPSAVASFLQRIGRTGRRMGSNRNCLFLATTPEALMQATALVTLWRTGFVEPIRPPAWPVHLLGQQLVALLLQEKSLPNGDWERWLLRLPCFAEISREDRGRLVAHLLENGFVHDDQGLWMIGAETESEFGFRHFAEFTSVFTSPPVFEVWHGRQHVGTVDQSNFFGAPENRGALGLGGRSWKICEINWGKRTVEVVPVTGPSRTRWSGGGKSLGFELCQAIQNLLCGDQLPASLSQRGRECLHGEREEFAWLRASRTGTVTRNDGIVEWWTFAGRQLNRHLSDIVAEVTGDRPSFDNLRLLVRAGEVSFVNRAIELLSVSAGPGGSVDTNAMPKFSELLPPEFRVRLVRLRAEQGLAIEAFRSSVPPR